MVCKIRACSDKFRNLFWGKVCTEIQRCPLLSEEVVVCGAGEHGRDLPECPARDPEGSPGYAWVLDGALMQDSAQKPSTRLWHKGLCKQESGQEEGYSL